MFSNLAFCNKLSLWVVGFFSGKIFLKKLSGSFPLIGKVKFDDIFKLEKILFRLFGADDNFKSAMKFNP